MNGADIPAKTILTLCGCSREALDKAYELMRWQRIDETVADAIATAYRCIEAAERGA